jgi:hypothetical protein
LCEGNRSWNDGGQCEQSENHFCFHFRPPKASRTGLET